MKKRYQVFVSSTFLDLQEERKEIMQALLELRCIPAGMELFPASNDEQWKLIKRVIDDSDYYVVIVGGRYGSLHSSGLSYTEMEYRYAVESGKPVMGFVHEDPSSLLAKNCDNTPELRAKLASFRELVGKKTIKSYKNPHDLGSKVSRAIINAIEESPTTGWIRADFVPNEEASLQILRLQSTIETLKQDLSRQSFSAPKGSELLAQADDVHELKFIYSVLAEDGFSRERYTDVFKSTWNVIFARVAPCMINEASDSALKKELDKFVSSENWDKMVKDHKTDDITNFVIDDQAFQTIKVQFIALGLIMQSSKKRSVTAQGTYWALTPYGDSALTTLRAIRKDRV